MRTESSPWAKPTDRAAGRVIPVDGSEDTIVDDAQIERIQRELDAVQAVLDGLDRIPPATSAEDDPAEQILALVGPELAGSDLIGDGHVVAVEEVEPLAEVVATGGVVEEPPPTEVGDAVAAGAELSLDAHDHPTVGDAEDLGPSEALDERVEGSHDPR